MATLTKAQLRDLVLEHIGVKAAGQSASAEDAAAVETAIDAAHAQLRKFGLVPFATSAIPEWAQIPLRDYVAGDIGHSFGFGDAFKPGQTLAERELARQVSGYRHPLKIRTEYF